MFYLYIYIYCCSIMQISGIVLFIIKQSKRSSLHTKFKLSFLSTLLLVLSLNTLYELSASTVQPKAFYHLIQYENLQLFVRKHKYVPITETIFRCFNLFKLFSFH